MKITCKQTNPIIVRIESEDPGDVFKLGKLAARMRGIWAGEAGDGKYAIHCSPEDLLLLALEACRP